MRIKIYIIIICCFSSCIKERPFHGLCQDMLAATVLIGKDFSTLNERSKNQMLVGCLLEHYGAEYNKATPPLQRHQDGY